MTSLVLFLSLVLLSVSHVQSACKFTLCGAVDDRGKYKTVHDAFYKGLTFYKSWLEKSSTFNVGGEDCTLEYLRFDGGTACAADDPVLEVENVLAAYTAQAQKRVCTAFFIGDLYTEAQQNAVSQFLANDFGYMTFTPWMYSGDSARTLGIGSFNGYLNILESYRNFNYGDSKFDSELIISQSRQASASVATVILGSNMTLPGVNSADPRTFLKYVGEKAPLARNADNSPDLDALRTRIKGFDPNLKLIVALYPTQQEIEALELMSNEALLSPDAIVIVAPYLINGETLKIPDNFMSTGRWPLSKNYGNPASTKYGGDTANFVKEFLAAEGEFPSDYNVYGAEMMALFHLLTERLQCAPPADLTNKTLVTAFSDCVILSHQSTYNSPVAIFSTAVQAVYLSALGPQYPHILYNLAFQPEIVQNLNGQIVSELSAQSIPASFPQVETQEVSTGVAAGIMAWAGLLMVIVIALTIFSAAKRDSHVIKASAYIYLIVMLLGLMLSLSAVFFSYPIRTKVWCNTVLWVNGVGFFITWIALIVKTYRLSRALQFTQNITSDSQLRNYALAFIALFIVILAICTALIPSEPEYTFINPLLQYVSCKVTYWTYIYLCIHLFTIVLAFFMSYQVRHAPAAFNESRYIVLVSVVTFFATIVYTLINLVFKIDGQDADFEFIIFSCYICFNAMAMIFIFFGPKLYCHFMGLAGRSDGRPRAKTFSDQSSFSFEIGEEKTQRWKPWSKGKWDPTLSAVQQRTKVDAMAGQFNMLLSHAAELTQAVRAQRTMLKNAGITTQQQQLFTIKYNETQGSTKLPSSNRYAKDDGGSMTALSKGPSSFSSGSGTASKSMDLDYALSVSSSGDKLHEIDADRDIQIFSTATLNSEEGVL